MLMVVHFASYISASASTSAPASKRILAISTAFAGVFSSDEEPILFAHSCGTNGVFDEVVVYFDLSVVEEGLELRPKAKGVVDGLA